MHTGMLPSWIQKYVGLKFGDKGRGPTEFDCWGIVQWVYRHELGIVLPDFMNYDSVTNDVQVEACVRETRETDWTRHDKGQLFDVVLFNIYGKPLHVGLVVANGIFLHAPEEDFTRIERYTDRHWNKRVEGFYRHEAIPGNR